MSSQMLHTMLHLIFSIVSLNGNDNVKEMHQIVYKNDSNGLRHP